MIEKLRAALLLLTTISLLTFVLGGGILYAAPNAPAVSDQIKLTGPVEMVLTVSPAVARPRDSVTIDIILTNRQTVALVPELLLVIPPGLSRHDARWPAGTTFNYQDNSLLWLPVLAPKGGSAALRLEFVASVADLTRPAQTVQATLRYDGQEKTAAVNYWVGLPPTVSAGASPAVVAVGQPVQLSALTTGPGPFVQSWNLGDGRQLTAADPRVVFAAPGTYQVTAQVANPLAVATATTVVTVISRPSAAFTVEDERPTISQTVRFLNQSGGAPPLAFQWDFGDGHTAIEANPSHQYAAPGTYLVHLVVQSEHGIAESSRELTVGVAPIADFVLDTAARTGEVVRGQAYADDTVMDFYWDMGNGHQYRGEIIEHVYYRAGDYLVTLRATNEYGETAVSHWIHVEPGRYQVLLPLIVNPVQGDAPLDGEAVGAPGAAPNPVVLPPDAVAGPTLTTTEMITGLHTAIDVEPLPPSDPTAEPLPAADPAPGAFETPDIVGSFPATPESVVPIVLPPQTPLPDTATPAEQLLWYVNEARRLHNLAPVVYNYELSIAAQMHSEDMAGNPDIMHEGSDGSRPAERQRRHGYLGIYGGEAVAWGWESPVPVVEFWVNSPPHRILILNPSARELGVGFYADGTAPNIWYWTAEFGIRLEEGPQPVVP